MRLASLFRWTRRLLLLAVLLACGWLTYVLVKARPQDLPWTRLRLDQPIGLFTGRKLAALTHERAACLALLRQSGLRFETVTPRGGRCPVGDAVRLTPGQALLNLQPARVAPSCPIVAGLALWQWEVVAPAAQRIFGASLARIEHYGSYACRRLYNRNSGDWSEHASADAIDISAFVLTDGRRITVAADWSTPGKASAFLHEVRDGACGLFSTVLSPDYNAAHHDHLHLDQAERGEWSWRACR